MGNSKSNNNISVSAEPFSTDHVPDSPATQKSAKKVHIQKLDAKTQPVTNTKSNIHLQKLTGLRPKSQYNNTKYFDPDRVYGQYTNGEAVSGVYMSNYFIGAYLYAYNNHHDIVLSVNDLWAIITMMLSRYINENAEALRTKFVTHTGQKELTVVEYTGCVEQSLAMEKQWDYFFVQILEQIKTNTNPDVVKDIDNDFSVSTPFYKLYSTVTIMDSFKKYFTYGRMVMDCGIPNAYLEGTRDDWTKLLEKINNLQKYAVDSSNPEDKLVKYVAKLSSVIQKCIDTYDGNVNVSFWNNIMTTETRRIGSGGQTQTYLWGWITYFIMEYGRVEFEDVKSYKTEVSVKLVNQLTNTTKMLTLYASFTGVQYDEKYYAYRPQLAICLYHHDENVKKREQNN
jgi:hypothetical protein